MNGSPPPGAAPGDPARSLLEAAAATAVEALLAFPPEPGVLKRLMDACRRTGSAAIALDAYARRYDALDAAGLAPLFSLLLRDLLAADPGAAEEPDSAGRRIRNAAYLSHFSPGILPLPGPASPPRTFRRNGVLFDWFDHRYTVSRPEDLTDASNVVPASPDPFIVECRSGRVIAEMVELASRRRTPFYKTDAVFACPRRVLADALGAIDLDRGRPSHYHFRFVDLDDLAASLLAYYDHGHRTLPRVVFQSPETQSGAFLRAVKGIAGAAQERIDGRLASAHAEFAGRYTDASAAAIPARCAERSLRILLLSSRFTTFVQYCIADLAAGLARIGCTADVYIEGDADATGFRNDEMAGHILEGRHDLVLAIDHFRYEFAGIPSDVPFVTWIQDMLETVTTGTFLPRLGRHDILLAMTFLDQLARIGYRDVTPFFAPVNIERFDGDPDRDEYDRDLVYVNHRPAASLGLQVNGVDPSPAVVALLAPLFARDPHAIVTMEEYVEALKPVFPNLSLGTPEGRVLVERARTFVGNALVRETIVGWAAGAGVSFDLYGSGWGDDPRFRPFARGAADNAALPRIYNRSRIVLHTHPCTTTHPRVYEAVASGGFVLVKRIGGGRDVTPLTDRLAEGEGYVFFDDRADLENKIRHYLAHPDERRAIARAGRERVRREHSHEGTARRLLEIVAARYAKDASR